jgi:hypothetical protein
MSEPEIRGRLDPEFRVAHHRGGDKVVVDADGDRLQFEVWAGAAGEIRAEAPAAT